MSKDKTLLEEGTVRRFMKLANMEALGTDFVNETFTTVIEEEEPVVAEDAAVYQDDEEETVELDLDAEEPTAEPADDLEMDVEMDADVEMDEPEADAGELTLTDEEAEVFLKVADKVRAAMDMGAPEELEAPDMGEPEMDMGEEPEAEIDAEAAPEEEVEDAEESEEVDMMENTVNEVARRIALRLQEMKNKSSE